MRALEVIRTLAENARHELGERAANGGRARPTVAQLNRTLERLASIVHLADVHLAGIEAEPRPPAR
jgi:predicted transcriptional regulator